MASQAVGAGMNVALSSLLGGLGVSLLDEKGDIAASLKRTLTPESLRNALAAGLTAGIAHNLIASTEVLKSGGTAAAQAPSSVMKHIHHAALQASAETVVHSALQTKDPGEALKSAVLHGAAHALHATASNSLGANEATLGVLGHKAGHMLAATAASHIGSGGGDLKTSLIHGAAATLGHMLMSHMVDPDAEAAALKKAHPHLSPQEHNDLLTKQMRGRQHLATLTSAAFGGLFGGDVATAAHLAGTAITHNYMSSAVMDAARKHFGFGTPEKEDIGTKKVFEGEEGEDQNEGDLFYLREGAKERSQSSAASRSYAMGQTAAALDPRGAIAESLRFRTPGRQAPSSAFFTPTWQSDLSASSHRF
ncbi:MAG TPA: DUF637 domain-containing protein, partial [Alphaproteobacteria bacterium]|nr:DUF637 domain-containing protein [Alphaproteobacteria bacterium]